MYVVPKDRGALCYLWWPKGAIFKNSSNLSDDCSHFWCHFVPSVESFVPRYTADDNSCDFPRQIVDAVYRFLRTRFSYEKSYENPEEAIQVSKQIRELLQRNEKGGMGDFTLTKWLSNNRKLMEDFRTTKRCTLSIQSDGLPSDKTLEIQWKIAKDAFELVVSKRDYPETRKGVLALVASVNRKSSSSTGPTIESGVMH